MRAIYLTAFLFLLKGRKEVIGVVFWKLGISSCSADFAENDIKPTIFTFNQLRVATEDFSERTKIGEGSFGAVYKVNYYYPTVLSFKYIWPP